MAWEQLALALAPTAVGLLQGDPKAPGYQPVALPDRERYHKELLDMAMNPNNVANELAAEAAADQVNRYLSRSGLHGSQIGGNIMSSSMGDLAMKFQEEKMRRLQSALDQVSGYDQMRAGVAQNNNAAAYEAAMNKYKQDLAGNEMLVGGVGALAGVGIQNIRDEEQRRWLEANMPQYQTYLNQVSPRVLNPGMRQLPAMGGPMAYDYGYGGV